MKCLGIDIGEKRIGIAISDALGITAQGLKTIHLKKPEDFYHKVVEVINEKKVQKLVIGLPKNMNGSLGFQAKKVQEQGHKLSSMTGLPLVFEDERLTTMTAERVLIQADQSRAKRKKNIDKLSAVIILQSYLDRENRTKSRGLS